MSTKQILTQCCYAKGRRPLQAAFAAYHRLLNSLFSLLGIQEVVNLDLLLFILFVILEKPAEYLQPSLSKFLRILQTCSLVACHTHHS